MQSKMKHSARLDKEYAQHDMHYWKRIKPRGLHSPCNVTVLTKQIKDGLTRLEYCYIPRS